MDPTVLRKKRGSLPPVPSADLAEATSRPSSPGAPSYATRGPGTITPVATMHADELLRTRRFLLVAMGMMVFAALSLPFLGGHPVLQWLFAGSLAAAALTCGVTYHNIRLPENYTQSRIMPTALTCLGMALMACYYFGLFSPAPMVFTFGIYFFSLGASLAGAVLIYILSAGLLLSGMLLMALGALPDLGLVRASDVTGGQKLGMALLVQMVLGGTFLFARLSRKATLDAVQGHDEALGRIRQQDALLAEAHQNLEVALGKGARGVYTGHMLGDWRLAEVIGRGAMGEVYEARHVRKGHGAAVKLLHREVAAEPDKMRRFLLEAELLKRLESPHIVKVFNIGNEPSAPPFIVMERLTGHDLAWHLRKRKRLSLDETVTLVQQVAGALENARGANVVHRDLKPQNIFLSEDPGGSVWKVLDFGVSKLGGTPGTMTRGHVIGTPGYMAPEQATGGEVDHRADVFALAVIAYRALTAQPPFPGEDYARVMFDLSYRQPKNPRELVPGLAEDIEYALAIGLAKKPRDRFTMALGFAEALGNAAGSGLSGTLRERARNILSRHPWGRRVKTSS